jgi:hypothetical protein
MARRSRDASPQRGSRKSSLDDRRTGAKRDQSVPPSGPSREDQEDREHRAFHIRNRARMADAEDRDR